MSKNIFLMCEYITSQMTEAQAGAFLELLCIHHSIDVAIVELYCKLVIKTESPDVCWQAQSCDWIINILIIILSFCF